MQLLSCHGIFWEAVQRWQSFPCHPAPAQPLQNKDNPKGSQLLQRWEKWLVRRAGNAPEIRQGQAMQRWDAQSPAA